MIMKTPSTQVQVEKLKETDAESDVFHNDSCFYGHAHPTSTSPSFGNTSISGLVLDRSSTRQVVARQKVIVVSPTIYDISSSIALRHVVLLARGAHAERAPRPALVVLPQVDLC